MTSDIDATTCGVCRTKFLQAGGTIPTRPTTVVDNLTAGELVEGLVKRPGAHNDRITVQVKLRALVRLAASNREQYRKLLDDELAAATLIEDEDLGALVGS